MTSTSPYILICKACGRQRELPAPGEPIANGWLRCACTGSTFSLRLRDVREALLKEPHP
jgi:hypothetical protein